MGFEDIRLAVEQRLAAWPDAPVAFDNVPTQPSVQTAIDAKAPWVRLTIVPGDSFPCEVGKKPVTRHTGNVTCQVFTAERVGSATAMQLAESLATHIEYHQDGHFEIQAASLIRVGENNGWYQVNISAPYRYR